ncbi:ATP-dependent DNA helicase RuvA [Paenibacillus swuensis]|uniref:Holliday junction branch migration complex subunit RuvA n=1 Tax=Paenibacillus swuensis TaxID=1178515 RepID=A0A172TK44_9BACL|nr:Holliday junction branch migration protein RuvA [Paenibacillus swuensis]ANE47187.1 ATP-dependent DNA helicase RuvA [Paenibacillus swuensis]
MIDFLRGRVAHRETEYIVMDVQGVGYRVFCPNPYAIGLKGEAETIVYIHHSVREDAILLFGFPAREEQTLFRRLLDVSGIGPRVALGILAGGKPDAVVAAIQQENVTFLTKLPGIGKKTAQRMILDLKDKLDAMPPAGMEIASGSEGTGSDSRLDYAGGNAWYEAKEALMALGYSETETDRAWSSIKNKVDGENDGVDVIMKKALQALFSG